MSLSGSKLADSDLDFALSRSGHVNINLFACLKGGLKSSDR